MEELTLPPQCQNWIAFYKLVKFMKLDGESTINMEVRHQNSLQPPTITKYQVLDIKTKALEELLSAVPPAEVLAKLCSLTRGSDAMYYFDAPDTVYNQLHHLYTIAHS